MSIDLAKKEINLFKVFTSVNETNKNHFVKVRRKKYFDNNI